MEAFPRTAGGAAIGRKRRWRLPPPLMQDGESPGPIGLSILEEFPSELGAVLWKSLRSTLLWAEQDVDSRRKLFDEGAADRRQLEILATVPDDATELRESLEDLLAVLDRPERTDREFVAVACTRVATWAEGRKSPRTGLEYLQAAAISAPADPVPALAAGRAARDLARYGRAEAWIYRAIGLARQAKEWGTYVDAYIALGKMMFQRGALPAARKGYLKALRRSQRLSDREREAITLHGLFILEHRAGNAGEALHYARQAVATHSPDHPDFPHLAHDIAYHWLERGEAEHALPIFLETLRKADSSARPSILGSISRAAGITGDVTQYHWARKGLKECTSQPGLAEAWVDVARGALELGLHDEGEDAARTAESIARQRREGQMRFLAEEIMGEIKNEQRRREEKSAQRREAARGPAAARLAREVIRSLQSVAPEQETVGVDP